MAVVVLLVAAMVAICAHAPSDTCAYSQLRWTGVSLGLLHQRGTWLLPRNQFDEVAHKPQLYFWLEAAALKLTGAYNDFVFRLPTVAASFVAALLVYVLGRRWYGRRVALLAAALWATLLHMSKLMYIATTDMLLAMWVTASMVCLDRLLFHPARGERRRWWGVGLWATMILGALTKGWGVVNPVLVGVTAALAVVLRPGFKALRRQRGVGAKAALTVRLAARRLWGGMRRAYLGWGLLAMAGVLVPLWVAMWYDPVSGQDFRDWVYHGIWQRLTGVGPSPPGAYAGPPVVHMLYYALPASLFAIGALFLVRPRRWFSWRSPIALPLCWMIGVVAPFSVTHGFRPDYLLPCYAAVALMGAWSIHRVQRLGRRGGAGISLLRHGAAAVTIAIGVAVIAGAVLAIWKPFLPEQLREAVRTPVRLDSSTWPMLVTLIPLGVFVVAAAVRQSLRWRVRQLGGLAVIGMVGVAFLSTHVISRHACTRDGEKMIDFAHRVGEVIGDDEFAVYRAERLGTEVYLGRFGDRVADPYRDKRVTWAALDRIRRHRWLVTCDLGLAELGAGKFEKEGREYVPRAKPEDIGRPVVIGRRVFAHAWGCMYLIEVDPGFRVSGEPGVARHVSGKRGRFW